MTWYARQVGLNCTATPDEYADAWLSAGGGLAVYGSSGRGGGNWLKYPLTKASRRGLDIKVLDLSNPGACDGLPARALGALTGSGLPVLSSPGSPDRRSGAAAAGGPSWRTVETVVAALEPLLGERNAVLCIRNFAATFLNPAACAGSRGDALKRFFSAARDAGFPVCVAMPTAHGLEEVLRAFAWIWCLGFDRDDKAANMAEARAFCRATQMFDPDALFDRPPLKRRKALVVQFGAKKHQVMRDEVDLDGSFFTETCAA